MVDATSAYNASTTPGSNTSIEGTGSQDSDSPIGTDDILRALASFFPQLIRDLGGGATVGGTADAITITPVSGSIDAVFDGLPIGFRASGDNTVTGVTANVGGLGVEPVKKSVEGVETTLAVGDIQGGGFYSLVWRAAWDSAGGAWELRDGAAYRKVIQTLAAVTFAAGGIPYASAADTLAALAIGTEGQALIGSSTPLPAWANRVTAKTVQATTSGTAFNFTGIPPSAKVIWVVFDTLSLDGTDNWLVQLGDADGIEATGYDSGSALKSASGNFLIESTVGFIIYTANAARTHTGIMEIINITGNTWVERHNTHESATPHTVDGAGYKTLSAALTQLTLTRTGTNNADLGEVNVLYM